MAAAGYRLGVDFGTSNTVAVLHRPDGQVRPLLFDSSPLLSSAVFVGPDAEVLTGADAQRAATGYPAGLEPNPKRRIDDGAVWLGERELPVVDLVAAVLGRVAAEARRVAGACPAEVVLTHPAQWGRLRSAVLAEAAARAGLGTVGLVPEPAAAAEYFAAVPGCPLPMGRWLVVYDLGAGTFDVAVLRRTVGGFEVVAADGLPDVGGLDLDAVVVGHLRSLTAGASSAWGRLDWPEDDGDQRARAVLWQGAREAKEQLSRHPAAEVYVPLVEARPRLTRDEFDKAARPHLDRTVALTLATLRAAGVTRETIAGLFLVGGSTRVPLVATLLHRALRVAPTVLEQPELVVAEGSLNAQPTTLPPSTSQPTTVRPTAPAERAPAPARGWVAPAPAPTHAGIAPAEVEPSDRVPTPRDAVLPVEEQETRGVPGADQGPTGEPVSIVKESAPDGQEPVAGQGQRRLRRRFLPRSRRLRIMAAALPLVVIAAVVGILKAWSMSSRNVLNAQAGVVLGVSFSPDGRTLATANGDGVRLWDVAGRRQVGNPLSDPHASGTTVRFSPDGRVLATAGGDYTARLWDVASHRQLGDALTGHTSFVRGAAFSPDGRILATAGGADNTARLWDVASHRQLADALTHTSEVTAVAFSTDGRILATGGRDARLWEVASHRQLDGDAISKDNVALSVAFSPDGRTLATGGLDTRLWDVADQRQIGDPLKGDVTDLIMSVAFSPDGGILATGGTGKAARLWDVASHRQIGDPLTGHTRYIFDMAFSPDGRTLATGSDDGTVRLWDVPASR